MDIQQIFEEAKRDPELLANIDLDELFEHLDTTEAGSLENTSLAEISETIFEKVKELTQNAEEVEDLCSKLAEYRYVDEVFQIQPARFIRYISLEKTPVKLASGGVVVDIKFVDSGTQVLCKSRNRFFQIHFDNHLIFQKLSADEQLYLMACEYLEE
jgi:hypothetical protein